MKDSITGFGMAQLKQEGADVRYDLGWTDPRGVFNKDPFNYKAVEDVLMWQGAELCVDDWRGAAIDAFEFKSNGARQRVIEFTSAYERLLLEITLPGHFPDSLLYQTANDIVKLLNEKRLLP